MHVCVCVAISTLYISIQSKNYFGDSISFRFYAASVGNWFTALQRNVVHLKGYSGFWITDCPVAQCHIPNEWNQKPYSCANLKS